MGDDSSTDPELLRELKRQARMREEHHQEYIQILVALSLFAGYITAFFNDMFNNFALNVAATILASCVGIFLLYKLIINSYLSVEELLPTERADRLFSGIYLFSVTGFAFVSVFIVGAEQLNISIQDIDSETVASAFAASMIPAMFVIFILFGRTHRRLLHRQEEKLKEQFPSVLDMLEEDGILNSGKRQALEERLFALLDKDRSRIPSFPVIGAILLVEGDDFTRLSKNDRSRILSILERIQRRHKFGEYSEKDLRKIEELIERAEESS